ncbi:hypothetical protein F2Q69_00029573 [Brassica cretica]|uniref:RNase H type-1 domain-containing protein n=1 Tax=Brassica cretica TaxID=69181 RepID=A0A8S9RT95_BRACR|nr:hypothetical protein F2Q69_00029573 [Brassica cretica]
MLEQLVPQEDVPLIRRLAISQSNRDDKFSWGYTKSGLYTVESGYWANSIPTNDMIPPNQKQGTQALCLQSICLVDGSWTSDSHCSGYGWVWLDESGKEQILGICLSCILRVGFFYLQPSGVAVCARILALLCSEKIFLLVLSWRFNECIRSWRVGLETSIFLSPFHMTTSSLMTLSPMSSEVIYVESLGWFVLGFSVRVRLR